MHYLTIALIAQDAKTAMRIAKEIAAANTCDIGIHNPEDSMISFSDGTHIIYGTPDSTNRWAGRYFDQIFICPNTSVPYYALIRHLLRDSCIPHPLDIQVLTA